MNAETSLSQTWERLLFVWHSYRLPTTLVLACFTIALVISRVDTKNIRDTLRKRLSARYAQDSNGIRAIIESPRNEAERQIRFLQDDLKEWGIRGKLDSELVQPTETLMKSHLAPKRLTGSRIAKSPRSNTLPKSRIQPLVFFASQTGTTESYAKGFTDGLRLFRKDSSVILSPQIHDLSYIDYDDFFVNPPIPPPSEQAIKYFYLLLLPTYNIDTYIHTFLTHLRETHHDFRIDTAPLFDLAGYSVFGFGDKEGWPIEEDGFCSQAVEVDKWMAKLTGGKRAFPLGLGDVKTDALERLEEWREGVEKTILQIVADNTLGEGVKGSGDAIESGEEDIDSDNQDKAGNKRTKRWKGPKVDDLEDLGGKKRPRSPKRTKSGVISSDLPIDFTTSSASPVPKSLPEMVPINSPTYNALTKQGYTIIGSHSGVKICRWTKSALRGRGSCYKYSFYGIRSHLCMETTPSLSCSNKCVFCWRHGTNPVATSWRWQVDPPDMVFKGAMDGHIRKIKSLRGVPGVRAERFQEAMRVRHCALSLVGEPIFYPHINEFVNLLHKDRISSFLVCNAQHPDQLQALKVVTQLYVSIDASNKESLRKVDRPLHRDFWERFLRCLDILRDKRHGMRTVFRLTLVKGFNIEDEVEGYADLVARGLPCFVEIKGVTYCGTSSSAGAGLTMQNVPFYEEIVAFVDAMNAALGTRGLKYGIAAEHQHSCCILIASRRFLVEGVWNTVIDYDAFFQRLESGKEFGPEDYMAPTPEWARWGNGGFDPADERVRRKGKNKDVKAITEAA